MVEDVFGTSTVTGFYIVKGDVNCDGRITIDDLALLQFSILYDVRGYQLSGDSALAADVNGDGQITTSDMTRVHMHLIGANMITEVVAK